MKTQNLFFMLILISMAFSFISCTDEDDNCLLYTSDAADEL